MSRCAMQREKPDGQWCVALAEAGAGQHAAFEAFGGVLKDGWPVVSRTRIECWNRHVVQRMMA